MVYAKKKKKESLAENEAYKIRQNFVIIINHLIPSQKTRPSVN